MNSVAPRIISLLFVGLTMFVRPAFAQIYHVQDMNTEQIKAFDREKTVVILPDGILEEHGPYMPSFTDGYMKKLLHQKPRCFIGYLDRMTLSQLQRLQPRF